MEDFTYGWKDEKKWELGSVEFFSRQLGSCFLKAKEMSHIEAHCSPGVDPDPRKLSPQKSSIFLSLSFFLHLFFFYQPSNLTCHFYFLNVSCVSLLFPLTMPHVDQAAIISCLNYHSCFIPDLPLPCPLLPHTRSGALVLFHSPPHPHAPALAFFWFL